MPIEMHYNPDVLSCLANLSNDEVFTPPNIANDMLDLLPEDLWSNPNATFLDPVTKSGVFLREIAKRLMLGLEKQIPDVQERINHIYTKQLFGIAITEITATLSRRSLYCSKTANGEYSIVTTFKNEEGNIDFERIEHNWFNGSCLFCGAGQSEYGRNDDLESHAYKFIHTHFPEDLYDMQFDVIVGNPPYQLNDGGGSGTSAMPIYQKFVEQAINLKPHYLSMIIPARWYSGGKGLDEFRDSFLRDNRLSRIVDYPEAIDAFQGVQIKGGVMYFLWDRDYTGDATVSTFSKGRIVSTMTRPLLENGSTTFIRYNEAIPILKKVRALSEKSIVEQVSSRKPFGIESNVYGKKNQSDTSIILYHKDGTGFIDKDRIITNRSLIEKYKVLVPKAGSGSDSFPHTILGKPLIAKPNSVCTETYLVIGAYDNLEDCVALQSYITTKFFRFLVLLKKTTQNAARNVYEFVPTQNLNENWTDEKLYEKYGLSENEIKFVESMIRPMELVNE